MNQKYDFKRTEREMQKFWEENEIYKFQNGREKKIFSIDTYALSLYGVYDLRGSCTC